MRKRAFGLAVGMIVGVALVSSSGAATTKAQKSTKINVSTRAAVVHYLRSIHVNPKGAVIQRGLRNYAGARCPGKGWTCASTRHTVVQIAKRGGQNRFACGTAKCVVVQLGGATRGLHVASRASNPKPPPPPTTNTATCVKTSGLSQSCTIIQPSSTNSNLAVVYENAMSSSGLTQTASATASITQTATGAGANTACVYQNIELDNSTVAKNGTPVTVTSEAHQSLTITQNSSSGGNTAAQAATSKGGCTGSSVTQTETLKSLANGAGSITQNQDAASNGPNVLLDIEQNQGTGFKCTTATVCPSSAPNSATFTQTSTQTAIANTPNGPVHQTQSSPDTTSPYSGLVGTVNQDSNNKSTATTTQNEYQCEDAATGGLTMCHTGLGDGDFNGTYPLTQTQYGPESVFKAPAHHQGPVHYVHKGNGKAIQTGGTGDTFTINQTSQQDADLFNNQHNTQEADCSTPGICTVNQTVIIDGNPTGPVTNSGQDLSNISIDCTGSSCTQNPPPGPVCNASSDTNALYNDMPTDVVNCLNPGIGFEATSTSEFGDEVGLAGGAGATLGSLNVDFQSWACQSGHWYDGACSSAPNASFQWPITANIYAVADCSGTPCPGPLLATTTQTQTIPYRPSATASCPANGAPAPAGAAWFNPMATGGGACQNSIGKVLTFNNWTDQGSFTGTLPDTVIWTVAFNTSDYGSHKVGPAACQSGPDPRFVGLTDGGCPYDSLNVGDKTYSSAPYAGTDTDVNTVAISTGSSPLALVTSAADWSAYRPLGEILVNTG